MNQISEPDLLADAIKAIGTPVFVPQLHLWLKASLHFDNVTILAFFDAQQPEVYLADSAEQRVFERMNSHYVTGAYLLDPFYALHTKRAAEGMYRLVEIAPDQFQRNEYYKSYYQRTTLADEVAFFSWPSQAVSMTVCIGRDATTGSKFSSRDLKKATHLAPIINALVRQNWSGIISPRQDASENGVDQLRQRLNAELGIGLSGRQAEIAILILQGHSSVSIGLTLGISPQTVKVFRKQLYKKCQISSQGELYYLIAPHLSQQGTVQGLAKA
ncbi:helix-turn-helix transcriptional regulator [Ruegeria atlantica]|uniref:helix-turn-helix transcriptional regulator n=1 Tax=Ruegeria atlantica TaxID=81569 RepID=UPI00147DA542|nr:helix-turn-helix transcriptional regulator [Ruegeria atlantica]